MRLPKKILLILVLGIFATTFPFVVVREVRAQAGRIYFEPDTLSLEAVDSEGTLEVWLSGVPSLSAFDVKFSYDNSKVHVDAVEIPSSVSGSKLGPVIDNEAGEVSFGAWTANRVGGGDFDFVNLIAGQESPVLLATISLTAVGEGSAPVSFMGGYANFFGTEAVEHGDPPSISVDTEDGLVQVGTSSGPEIILESGWNRVIWPAGLGGFTSLSALGSIPAECGSAPAISRKKNGRWESAVYGYGGVGFLLSEGGAAHARVAFGCVWSP